MRRRLILAALAALPVQAGAATTLSAGQVLRGRFTQDRHLRGFDAPLRTEGRFVLAPGRGLIWQAETPFAVTTVITAAGLVQNVDGSETMRLPAARLPFLSRLYAMLSGALSGDWRGLEPDFVVVRSGDAAHWQAELTPRRPDAVGMPFSGITVSGSQFVDQVRINKPNGDWEQLAFLNQILSDGPVAAGEASILALPGL
jgi:hypothetical protein